MTEADKLAQAQGFITQELQKQGIDRKYTMTWEQTPQDRATKIHRLVLSRGCEKYIFTFTEYELLDKYGSRDWEKQLRGHIGDVLMEL